MKDKDKVLKEMQIQIYTYEEINGETPVLVISGNFYENLWFELVRLYNVEVDRDDRPMLLGCRFKVSYSLAFDEFIVGEKVQGDGMICGGLNG